MLLSEVTPGPNGYDYRTFECQKCGHVHAVSVSQDPMQSEMCGWLAGELKPPT
jgi:transcription elongation factor Elf1